MKIKSLLNRKSALALFACLALVSRAHAQVSVGAPSSSLSGSCDDFFSRVLGDPADMQNSEDIYHTLKNVHVQNITQFPLGNNNFIPYFNNGNFEFVVQTKNQGFPDPYITFFSPRACGAIGIEERTQSELLIKDIKRYNKLTVKMYSSTYDEVGFRLLWNRGCSGSGTEVDVTVPIPVKRGWHTYEVDLSTVGIAQGNPWAGGGDITGLAILPAYNAGARRENSHMKIDWVRLSDRNNNCSSISVPVSASAEGDNNFYAAWLVDENVTNPFDMQQGFIKQVVPTYDANGNLTTAQILPDLQAGKYKVLGMTHSDYATLALSNPWDMNDGEDIINAATAAAFDNLRYEGGLLKGTSKVENPNIWVLDSTRMGSVPKSFFKKLSFRLPGLDPSTQVAVFWHSTNGTGDLANLQPSTDGVYHLDLANYGTWEGALDLIIQPRVPVGTEVSLDFISLRSQGFVNEYTNKFITGSDSSEASSLIEIKAPPQVDILYPDLSSGESVFLGNMKPSDHDVALVENFLPLDQDDPEHPGEKFSAYLPDVRTVDGLRGDFFKGTTAGSEGDPVVWMTFPLSNNTTIINADLYKNLCFKMLVDGRDETVNTTLETVGRVLWQREGSSEYVTSQDILTSYDVWNGSRWKEYCMRLDQVLTEGPNEEELPANWSGNIQGFRVDPHEIIYSSQPTRFYLDYVKLRKNAVIDGQLDMPLNITRDDLDTSVTVEFYANTTKSIEGGTLIASNIYLPSLLNTYGHTSQNGKYVTPYRQLIDTSALANGEYYLYAKVTDSRHSSIPSYSLTRAPITVDHSSDFTPSSVAVSIQEPASGLTTCKSQPLKVRGYALHRTQNRKVTGAFLAIYKQPNTDAPDPFIGQSLTLNSFSPEALAAFPDVDSSNSGFNTLVDVSSLPDGQYYLRIQASGDRNDPAESGIGGATINIDSNAACATSTETGPTGQPVVLSGIDNTVSNPPVSTPVNTPVSTPDNTPVENPAPVELTAPQAAVYPGSSQTFDIEIENIPTSAVTLFAELTHTARRRVTTETVELTSVSGKASLALSGRLKVPRSLNGFKIAFYYVDASGTKGPLSASLTFRTNMAREESLRGAPRSLRAIASLLKRFREGTVIGSELVAPKVSLTDLRRRGFQLSVTNVPRTAIRLGVEINQVNGEAVNTFKRVIKGVKPGSRSLRWSGPLEVSSSMSGTVTVKFYYTDRSGNESPASEEITLATNSRSRTAARSLGHIWGLFGRMR